MKRGFRDKEAGERGGCVDEDGVVDVLKEILTLVRAI